MQICKVTAGKNQSSCEAMWSSTGTWGMFSVLLAFYLHFSPGRDRKPNRVWGTGDDYGDHSVPELRAMSHGVQDLRGPPTPAEPHCIMPRSQGSAGCWSRVTYQE